VDFAARCDTNAPYGDTRRVRRVRIWLLNLAPSAVTREPLVSRSFLLLVMGQFMQSLGYSTLPLLPLYLTWMGATRLEIGVTMAVGSIGGLVFRPVVGWALDRVGRRPTLLVGTVMLGLATILLGWVREPGWLLYADRVLFGLGVGCLFTGYFTWAADLVPASRRTEGLALFGIAGLLPLCVNPISTELGLTGAEIRWLFPWVGVLILCSLFFVLQLKEPERAAAAGSSRVSGRWRDLFSLRLFPVWLATVTFSAMVAVFFSYATLTAETRGVDRATWMWFLYAGGAIGVRLFGSRLPDRIGPSNLMAPALASYVVALLLCAQSTTWESFLLCGLLAGVGHGYCFPILTSQAVSRADASSRGRSLSVFTGLWDVALLVLTPAFGAFADAWDDASMFGLVAMCAVCTMGIWVVLESRAEASKPPVFTTNG
jgi:MFS family permease